MAKTKIRLPQLNAESLTVNSGTALVFKEQGVAAAYLTFDTVDSEIELGDGSVDIILAGELGGASFKDEDNMASDSATAVASQQSIKAYVDDQLTAQDMDITSDSGTIDVDLDSETLTVAGGEGIDTSAAGTTITVAMELATDANVGGASFSSADFAVSGAGAVTIKTAGIATAQIADDQITAALMADNSVNSDMYVDGSIDLIHMSANSVDSNQYVDGSIDLIHMSANSVDSDQYVDGSIDNVHLAANSVDSDQYIDGSIDTDHIADNQVTLAKMADLTATQFILGDGSNNPAAVSMSGDATMSNAGAVTVTKSAGDFLVTGDLQVMGDRNIVNTKHVTFEDSSLTLAVPGGMKDALFAYTHATTLVTVASTGHGFATGEFVYFQHDVPAPLLPEEVYAVTVTGLNEFTFEATSSGGANLASGQSCNHSVTKCLDAGSDGAGIKIPRASGAGMPQISWSESGAKFQVKNADLEVTTALHITGQSNLNGHVVLGDAAGDNLTFTGKVATDILPNANGTKDLGAAGSKWAEVHSLQADLGNLRLSANALVSTDVNGNIAITPNGNGEVDISKVDIDSGTIDAITSLTVANDVDIGNFKLTSKALEASDLTSGRVVIAGANGLLADDSDMTFATDTLTVTKLGAFEAAGAINFATQNMTNVDIDSGTIDGTPIAGSSGAFTTLSCNAKALDITGLNIAGTGSSLAALAAGDHLAVADASDSANIKKTTMADIQTFLAGAASDKIVSTMTGTVVAGNLVNAQQGFPNMASTLLLKVHAAEGTTGGAGLQATKSEIYLNGMLMSRQDDGDYSGAATLVEDFAYDTDAAAGSPAPGLVFSMDLVAGDHIAIMVRS